MEPAPERERKTTWAEFLKMHWDVMGATDFFTVEVWTLHGLVRYHVLFVIRLSTRKVNIAGIAQPMARGSRQSCAEEVGPPAPKGSPDDVDAPGWAGDGAPQPVAM